ncbi:MAG: hypothetical protein J5698_04845 [Bacteroidaceae bacterium]|nr:hypothetical protein [Bacteroidaceae bacterium]
MVRYTNKTCSPLFRLPVMTIVGLVALLLASCDDFFAIDSANVLDEDDYISRESEMYRGFLGIVTRMQEVGDHAIFLTDPRSNYLEPTGNAPIALQDIANYADTDGNDYADPVGYYAVIVACNDFIMKMDEFYDKVGGALSDSAKVHIPRLVSCALRDKVWAYSMLSRIYGEAYWFDTNITELTPLTETSTFQHLDVKGICDHCIDLLDNGIDVCGQHVPATLEMDWTRWVDPVNGNANYSHWKYMTPAWLPLRVELASWRTNYEDAAAAAEDWQWVRDNVLAFLNAAIVNHGTDWYSCSMQIILNYPNIFWTERVGLEQQILGAVYYDYQNKQYNRLVQYFCPEYPGDGYYLRPSQSALATYSEADIRGGQQRLISNTLGGELAFSKYYYTRLNNQGYLRSKIYEIEPTIPLYRGHDLHFLLAEAENHLGHWDVAGTLLNMGILNRFPGGDMTLPTDSLEGQPIWDPSYSNWFASSGGYGDIGIVGASRGTAYNLPSLPVDASPEEKRAFAFSPERIRAYDLALADEYLKEFTGEGKSYSYLVKMAERYDDYRIIYDRVSPKYDAFHAAQVESSLREHRFIRWKL